MPVPPGEERGEMGKSLPVLFFCLHMQFLCLFRYISCFLDNKVLMGELYVALQMLDLCGLPTLHGTSAVPDQRPQLPPPGEQQQGTLLQQRLRGPLYGLSGISLSSPAQSR
jgi:hypothetical protein